MSKQPNLKSRLLFGAAIFGVGWGLVGLCPGPAIADLSLGGRPVMIFVLAMIGGMAIFKLMDGLLGGTPSASAPPSAGMERAR